MSYESAGQKVLAFVQKRSALFFMMFLVALFGYVTLKDNPVPKWLLIGAVALAAGVYFLSGLGRDLLKRETLVYLLIVYLPFAKQVPVDFDHLIPGLNFTNLLISVLTAFWFMDKGKVWSSTSLNWPIFLFLVIGLISTFRGMGLGADYVVSALIQYYRVWMIPLFLYFLVVNTVRDRETVKNIVMLIVIVVTLVGLMSIYEYWDTGDRVGGIFDEPNFLAAFFTYYMYVPLSFFLMNVKQAPYWILLGSFLICFRGIMVTFSRAGYLSFAAGLYAFSFFYRKRILLGLIFASAVVLMNPKFLPEGMRYRLAQTIVKQPGEGVGIHSEWLDQSTRDRLSLWSGATWMIREHPVFGVGYNLFESKIAHYWHKEELQDPHNSYLLIASEMGLPALLVFLWLLGAVFRNAHLLYRSTNDPFAKGLALGCMGGFFSLMVSNLYGSRFNSGELSCYFWILQALVTRLRFLEKGAHE